jgi:hypothetical protein
MKAMNDMEEISTDNVTKTVLGQCKFGNNPKESKSLRTFGEQLWRAKCGWPILCGK